MHNIICMKCTCIYEVCPLLACMRVVGHTASCMHVEGVVCMQRSIRGIYIGCIHGAICWLICMYRCR